jgi:hypothetical protein
MNFNLRLLSLITIHLLIKMFNVISHLITVLTLKSKNKLGITAHCLVRLLIKSVISTLRSIA